MDEARLEEILDEAYEALEENDVTAAAAALDSALELAPDDRDVLVLLADVRASQDNVDAAFEALEKGIDLYGDDPVLLLRKASLLFSEDASPVEALELLEQAARDVEAAGADLDEQEEAERSAFLQEVYLLMSDCRADQGDLKGALDAAKKAVACAPEEPEAHLAVATAQFDLCELADARRAAGEALRLDPEAAGGHWIIGQIETLERNDAAADQAFARAASLEPESYHPPTRVDAETLTAIVEKGLEDLPEEVRSYMENVAVIVEDVPDVERVRQITPPLSPGLLGLFEGNPPREATSDDPTAGFPRQITLFRKNIELVSRDRDDLRKVVLDTLVHEVGHYIGLDEEDLADRGLA